MLPTPVFFYGLEPGEEIAVEIEPGKTLIIKFLTVGEPHADGTATVFFELNGQPREVTVADKSLETTRAVAREGRPEQPEADRRAACRAWSSPSPCKRATKVAKGQKLLTLEAMKMETTIDAERDGRVAQLCVHPGSQVETGQLLLRIEA